MYQNTIEQDIKSALFQVNLNLKIIITKSSFENFDYQTNILFQINKKDNFQEIKEKILQILFNTGHYESVKITGKGFISFKVYPQCYISYKHSNPKHIVVDYCGVNVAKKMHIGHIRSMFIGDYICKAHEFMGDKVTKINHIGDWGNQFGFLLLYIIEKNLPIENNKQLTEYYKQAYQLYKNDKLFANKSTNAALSLQNKQEPFYSLWKKCCDISIQEMNEVTKEFNLSIKESDIQGESFYTSMLPSIEKELLGKVGAIKQEDGTLIIEFEDLPTLLLKKSTGSYLYAMYDIAAIKWRVNNLKADKIIYVVDKRQELHFKQVFAIAQLMGWSNNCQLQHVGFGFILDKNGVPLKTKSGSSLYLDELINDGFKEIKSYSYYDKLEGDYKDIVIKNTLYGALKFFDLHGNPKTDYQFDWNNILNPKGGTAPYIQNAYVRIDSILYKNNILNKKQELNILKNLDYSLLSLDGILLYKETIKALEDVYITTKDYACHTLEESILKVCKQFHAFYEKENINNSINKNNQLALLIGVKHILEKICFIFGVELYLCSEHFNYKNKCK